MCENTLFQPAGGGVGCRFLQSRTLEAGELLWLNHFKTKAKVSLVYVNGLRRLMIEPIK